MNDFLTFASGFLEKLWKKTEDQMHGALLAVDAGTVGALASGDPAPSSSPIPP